MHAQSPVSIQRHDQPNAFAIDDKATLISVVDQLNAVTERLHALEDQIANGTLIINQQPTGHLHLAEVSEVPRAAESQTGWQPTRR